MAAETAEADQRPLAPSPAGTGEPTAGAAPLGLGGAPAAESPSELPSEQQGSTGPLPAAASPGEPPVGAGPSPAEKPPSPTGGGQRRLAEAQRLAEAVREAVLESRRRGRQEGDLLYLVSARCGRQVAASGGSPALYSPALCSTLCGCPACRLCRNVCSVGAGPASPIHSRTCRWFQRWCRHSGYRQWDRAARGPSVAPLARPGPWPGPMDTSSLLELGQHWRFPEPCAPEACWQEEVGSQQEEEEGDSWGNGGVGDAWGWGWAWAAESGSAGEQVSRCPALPCPARLLPPCGGRPAISNAAL